MKILFCSVTSKTKSLGLSKAIVELSEELERLNWDVDFITPSDLLGESFQNLKSRKFQQLYSQSLRDYLKKYAKNYDVVDYDHGCLPYSRLEFPPNTLMVARSGLLAHHFKSDLIKILLKPKRNWKSELKFSLKQFLQIHKFDTIRARKNIMLAEQTCREADLINVPNNDDKLELIKSGIPEAKICVIRLGISRLRRTLFDQISSNLPTKRKVAFVGTFDYRKGASDFPKILVNICQSVPDVSFQLIGTKGLYVSKQEVLNFFPQEIRNKIEVIPSFDPDDLPGLLSDCSLGIFPSYLEGFGFGVLEMLAASVPVIAYNSPGPPMMLPAEYLVDRGDADGMAKKVVALLNDSAKLSSARIWAKERSQQFCWENIAKQTSHFYLEYWQKRQVIISNKTLSSESKW